MTQKKLSVATFPFNHKKKWRSWRRFLTSIHTEWNIHYWDSPNNSILQINSSKAVGDWAGPGSQTTDEKLPGWTVEPYIMAAVTGLCVSVEDERMLQRRLYDRSFQGKHGRDDAVSHGRHLILLRRRYAWPV